MDLADIRLEQLSELTETTGRVEYTGTHEVGATQRRYGKGIQIMPIQKLGFLERLRRRSGAHLRQPGSSVGRARHVFRH